MGQEISSEEIKKSFWTSSCISDSDGNRFPRRHPFAEDRTTSKEEMFDCLKGFLGGYSDEGLSAKGKVATALKSLGNDGGAEGIWGKNGNAIRTPGKNFGCQYYCDRQALANTSRWSKTARGELYGTPPSPLTCVVFFGSCAAASTNTRVCLAVFLTSFPPHRQPGHSATVLECLHL